MEWRNIILRISVVVTTYNGKMHLEKQLLSLLQQERAPDEVLIFDDGSTDGTIELVQSFIRKNCLESWQFYVNVKRKGWKQNFMEGLRKAAGDILFPCDQDEIWYPKKLAEMTAVMEQHPEIKIYVSIKNTGTIEQAVVDNQLDFALVEGTVTHPEIISEVFSADTLCMVAAPGHPLAANRTVTLADAASCPLLLREPGSAGREIVESLFLSGGIQIAPAWESVSTLALIRAAQNGLGIAILPELLVRDALKSGDLVSLPLPPDILTRSLYLIRHRNKYLSSSAEEFQNLCRMWKF